MGVQDWSTTPGNNTTIAGLSAAEGSTKISSFNNMLRQIEADVRAYANDAEWFERGTGDGAVSPIYVSGTSFKFSGADVTAAWHVGRRVKASGSTTGTIFGTITGSSFSTDTTITVTWDSGSLSNESLTVWLAVNSAQNTSLPVASASAKGISELATTTEVLAAVDTARAVTPDALAALWEKGADIASAATISIGEGGYFHITGTTTITDIDFATDKEGREAILIFDGILTITNSASLICQGGADITTDAGGMARVVSEGSDVVRVFYQRKDGAPLAGVAAQSDLESASNLTKLVPPGRMKYHPGVAKAWGRTGYSGGTPVLDVNYNISSVTDNGTGDITYNFTVSFSSANYARVGMAEQDGAFSAMMVASATAPTASACRIQLLRPGTDAGRDLAHSVAFYGDQ